MNLLSVKINQGGNRLEYKKKKRKDLCSWESFFSFLFVPSLTLTLLRDLFYRFFFFFFVCSYSAFLLLLLLSVCCCCCCVYTAHICLPHCCLPIEVFALCLPGENASRRQHLHILLQCADLHNKFTCSEPL